MAKDGKTKGIVLLAIGKRNYAEFAVNMAVGLKYHNKDIKIQLVYRPETIKYLQGFELDLFDVKTEISVEHTERNGKFSPGFAKIMLYDYFAFDENIYLDVDGLPVKDITPLFDECKKDIHSQFCRVYPICAEKWECQWMTLQNTKKNFNLQPPSNIFEINSSFIFVRKGDISKDFYHSALANYSICEKLDKSEFGTSWGGTIPDEICFNPSFAQNDIDPRFEFSKDETVASKCYPILFMDNGTRPPYPKLQQIAENQYLIGMYGGKDFTSNYFSDDYNGLYKNLCTKYWSAVFNKHCPYKPFNLMQDKHVHNK